MSQKRNPAPIHSQKTDRKGRTKNRRHGTGHWVNWTTEQRVDAPLAFLHAGKAGHKG